MARSLSRAFIAAHLAGAMSASGHYDFEAHAPDKYRARVLAFLAQALQRPN
jgi:hypothetical protein